MLHPTALLLCALPAQVQVEIVPQPYPGGVSACSSNGVWAVGGAYVGSFEDTIGLRWSAETGFDRLHGTVWPGIAIADDGETVLTHAPNADGALAAALWTPSGLQVLSDLGGATSFAASYATGLTRDGRFAAGVAYPWNPYGLWFEQAVRWSADGTLIELAAPPEVQSRASDLSDDGRVVVGSVTPLGGPYYGPGAIQNTSSAVWTDGAFELIDDAGQAFGASSDGHYVVGASQGAPYRWDPERGKLRLEVLPPRPLPWAVQFVSQGLQISDDGATALCLELAYPQGSPQRLYLWRAGAGAVTISELASALGADELLGFDLLQLASMSADGRVLTGSAYGYGPPVSSVFWRMTLPPAAQVYCTPQTSAAGCTPALGFTGTPSARSGAGFTIEAHGVPAGARAVLAYGSSGAASAPFGGGVLCVAEPTTRVALGNAGGAEACEGALAVDFNAVLARSNAPALVGGARVWAQLWIRDDGTASAQILFSDALAFTLWP